MHRTSQIFFSLPLLFLTVIVSVQAGTLTAFRVGSYPRKNRLVFEWDKKVDFRSYYDTEKKGLVLLFTDSSLSKELPAKQSLPAPYLDSIEFRAYQGEHPLLLAEVRFRYPAPLQLFTLNDPFRIVIDVSKVFEKKEAQLVGRGIVGMHWVKGTPNGPVEMVAVIADRLFSSLQIFYSKENLHTRKRVKDWAKKEGLIAAINGGYFSGSGLPLGALAEKGMLLRESLWNRSALWVNGEEISIAPMSLHLSYQWKKEKIPVQGINRERNEGEVILYTPAFGKTTRTNIYGIEWIIRNSKIEAISNNGNALIPENGAVLSFHKKAHIPQAKVGDKITLKMDALPQGWLLQAGPRLLKKSKIEITGETEKFKADILKWRAPRSLFGFNETTFFFLKVFGRSERSLGATLEEAARYLQELGAKEGLNLDGGKSSQLYLQDFFEESGVPVPDGIGLLPKTFSR